MKIIAYYSVFLGFMITGLWIMLLRTDAVTEGKTEIVFHLFSEFLMAVLCILSGFKMLMNHRTGTAVNIIAHSMVIYSVLNAAGYYGQKGETGMMIFFIVLLSISALIILTNLRRVI